jgi:hypothetical protein
VLYLANPSTPAIRAAMHSQRLGAIAMPAQGNVLPTGVVWCADNGCGPGVHGIGGGFPGYSNYLGWLQDLVDTRAPTGATPTRPVRRMGCARCHQSTPLNRASRSINNRWNRSESTVLA